MKNPNQKQRGFTLIELMITVAIAAILLTVGVPSMRTFIQNGRITSITNELVAAINKARSEAINNNSSSCVCPSADVVNPVPTCAGNGSWEAGWIAFTDTNANCVIDGTDVLLRAWDGQPYVNASITVRNNNVSINATNQMVFNSRGEPRLLNGVSQQGVFRICDNRGLSGSNDKSVTASGVVLSPGGSARSTRSMTQLAACP